MILNKTVRESAPDVCTAVVLLCKYSPVHAEFSFFLLHIQSAIMIKQKGFVNINGYYICTYRSFEVITELEMNNNLM